MKLRRLSIPGLAAIAICFFTINLFAEGGGSDVGSGGDAVKCTARVDSPVFALDYLMTSSGDNSDVVAIASWEESRDRLLRLLAAKIPDLGRSLKKFIALMDNRAPHIDYLKERIWEGSDNELRYLNDQKLTRLLSGDCVKLAANEPVPIIQAVIRQHKINSRVVYYEYDKTYYDWMRSRTPLQFSFLMIHEWLWDLTEDVQAIRRANRFLHSTQLEALGPADLRLALEHIGISLRQTGFKPICERTPAVKRAIEESQGRACSEIDLANFDADKVSELDLDGKGIQELENGDFGGLYRLETLHLHNNQLAYLPEDVFAGLFDLRVLTLHGNQLKEVPARLIADSPHLSMFSLARNPIHELPEGLLSAILQPQDTDELNLFLNQLPLTSLPSDFLAKGRRFGVLDLRGTPLSDAWKTQLRNQPQKVFWKLRLDP